MNWTEQALALAAALAIGLLIGIERGWKLRSVPEGSRVAGVRTFILFGLVGGVAGLLGTSSRKDDWPSGNRMAPQGRTSTAGARSASAIAYRSPCKQEANGFSASSMHLRSLFDEEKLRW